MLLIDTNSLGYIIETENIFQDFHKEKNYLSTAIIQKNENVIIISINHSPRH